MSRRAKHKIHASERKSFQYSFFHFLLTSSLLFSITLFFSFLGKSRYVAADFVKKLNLRVALPMDEF